MNLTTAIQSAVRLAADLVFPQTCVHCRTEGKLLCDPCLAQAPRVGPYPCSKCAMPLAAAGYCARCAQAQPPLAQLRAVFRMEGAIKDAVHALKYDDLRAIALILGTQMANAARRSTASIDLVAPVPLHHKRLRDRGYNQAELLAIPVARQRGTPLDKDLLARIENTPPQARAANEAQRKERVLHAFTAAERARGKRVLLVDDVATTCSTLNACARELYRAGAKNVRAIVLAREI